MANNNNNSTRDYLIKRVIKVLTSSLGALGVGLIGRTFSKIEAKDALKRKEQEYDLRNKKAIELRRMVKEMDKVPIGKVS